MTVLTRYLLRIQIAPFLFAFMALTGLVLINTLAQELAGLAGKGLPMKVFAEFFLLSLPANIALTLPMSVLVSVLYTFSQLAADNEITALKASGVDLRRMVFPLLVGAGLIAGGTVWFNDRVLPAANYRWRILMADVAQTSPLLLLEAQTINAIDRAGGGASYYLRAGRIDHESSRMRDVVIYDVSNPELSRTIYADSGTMALNPARTDLVLTLFDGHVREVQLGQPAGFRRTDFQEQLMRMEDVSQQLQRSEGSGYRTDREMTLGMMRERLAALRDELLAQTQAGSLSPSSGLGADDRVQRELGIRGEMRELQVEVHKKYSIAAAALVFVLIGVPLALRFPGGGAGMVSGVSLVIFSVYWVGLKGGEILANKGVIPPTLAMWQTNVIFGLAGLFAMWHLGNERGAGRSGRLGEWLARIT